MGKIDRSAVPAFILTVLCLFALPAQGQYNGGSGDPCDPYQINDPCQLNAIGANPDDWDKHFILTADIDLAAYTGEQFNIIGNDHDHPFIGSFDGDGFMITNFTYSSINTNYTIGLFGRLGNGGEIKNVGMTNININRENNSGNLLYRWFGGT